MKKYCLLILSFSCLLTAEVVHFSQLPPELQNRVVPDLEGNVLINENDSMFEQYISSNRDLPAVAPGWPVSYGSSNCKNGAIYVNMDADSEMEILFGVGTKITALNLDGSTVPGWPVQLGYYIWSSPAAGDIDGDGEIDIVCTSRNNTTGNIGALYAFELDGSPKPGFPVTQAGGGTNNVCLYDLDNDGAMEILVNVRNSPQGWVYVFRGDGSLFPGFPQELDYFPGAGVSAGDITGDGLPEIVSLSYHKLHVFDLSGNLLPGFPVENPGFTYSYSQPVIYDLDGDGYNDIIWGGCAASTGAVFAVKNDGSALAGWPQMVNYWIFGTVSLGDLDQDGSLDVVIGDQVGSGTPVNQIYAWDASGNNLPGFPAGPTNAIYAQIGIADLDGDGFVELMIDDNNFGFGYDAYNHDGTHCSEWPLPCGTIWSSTTMQITPVFGDVNNDGFLEIIGAATDIMGWVVECYLWDTDAIWNDDLAYMIIDGCNIQHNGLYETATAPPTFDPPVNLAAEVLNFNEVQLGWQSPISRALSGFKVYRDDILLTEINDPQTLEFWDEYGLDAGNYEYFVTALYEDPAGESEPSNIEEVIVILPEPQNLNATLTGSDILIEWSAPQLTGRNLESYTLYIDDDVFADQISGTSYLLATSLLDPGTYSCYVTAVFTGGFESDPSAGIEIIITGIGTDDIVSLQAELAQNFPNPFNPITEIFFSTSEKTENTEIVIYNLKGQKIKTLINKVQPAGNHSVVWNGTDEYGRLVASGVYLYQMKLGNYHKTKKMILLQ